MISIEYKGYSGDSAINELESTLLKSIRDTYERLVFAKIPEELIQKIKSSGGEIVIEVSNDGKNKELVIRGIDKDLKSKIMSLLNQS